MLVKDLLSRYNIRIPKIVFTKDLIQKLVLGCIVVVLFFYVDSRFILGGMIRSRAKAGAEVKELRKNLANFRTAQKRLSGLNQTQLENQRAKLAAGGTLIRQDGIVALIQIITETANKHGVRISNIRPVRSQAEQGQSFQPLLITLDGTGEYHNAVKFISDLESGSYFLAVQAIRITPQQDVFKQKIHLVLKTYVQ